MHTFDETLRALDVIVAKNAILVLDELNRIFKLVNPFSVNEKRVETIPINLNSSASLLDLKFDWLRGNLYLVAYDGKLWNCLLGKIYS